MSSYLLATVEQPLPLWFHLEDLHDFETQLVHLCKFG